MVFQSRKAVAPEMPCALVAVVDLARVCEMQPCYRGEFGRCDGGCGEDGGAGADADVEELVLAVSLCLVGMWYVVYGIWDLGWGCGVVWCSVVQSGVSIGFGSVGTRLQ